MISTKAIEHIRTQGKNGASFQSLYSGYRYFSAEIEGEFGVVAYVDTATAWIGAAEPVISEGKIGALLKRFRDEARLHRKTTVLLPVSKVVATEARKLGWYAIQIGSEPWYILNHVRETQNAKQFSKKGAKVERFEPTALSDREKLELDELTDRWLASRKMATLSFLNRVEPWQLFHEKRYFRVTYRNQQIAYLAAVPIRARNAWYLVDLIREPDSPPGASELLIVESAKRLREEGATEVTLGMSPFVPASEDERPHRASMYRVLDYVFHRMETFYGFKSLYQYKMKFNPDRWEPQYLISLDSSLGIRSLIGLSRAIFPKGLIHTTLATAFRFSGRFSLGGIYRKVLNNRIVPKSPPPDFWAYLTRCKITVPVILLSTLYFFTSTDAHFHIRKNMVERYSYSFENLINGNSPTRGFIDIIISSFLHWDIVHLLTNFSMAIFLMSFLECLCGSGLTFIAYFSGILFTNPLTTLIMSPFLYAFFPNTLERFLHEPDIGCSLGIFSCIGLLSWFVKRPVWLLGFFSLVTLIYNITIHSWLGCNHLIALGIGYVIGKHYVHST